MTCTVSGIAKRPDGSVYANATFKVMPSPATPVGQDGAVWFPRETTIITDGTGAMLVDLVTGNYAGWDTANGFKFEFAVPDAPTASWADCFNAAAVIVSTIVSNAQLADMQTGRLKGRTSAGTGDPEDLTAAQVKSLLAIGTADVAGLGALAAASSVNLSTQATGILQAAQEPAHTGDVTNAAGSLALTIAANAVSNSKLAIMAANTVKANATSGAAVPTDVALAASQLLGRGSTGNVAPIILGTNLSMSGATLNATGGGGSGVDLTTDQTVDGIKTLLDPVGLAAQVATPAAPASGLLLYGQSVAGMMAAEIRGVGSRPAALQHALYDRKRMEFLPNNAGGTLLGAAIVPYGDLVYNIGQSTANAYSAGPRSGWRNLATTPNQQMGFTGTTSFFRGNAANVGGFFFQTRAGFEAWTNGGRMFVGLGTGAADVFFEPSYQLLGCGFIIDSGDAGLISFVTRSNYNTYTKVSTGLTAATDKGYDFHISCEPNSSQIGWMIRDVNVGTEVSGTATTNLWTNTVAASLSVFAGNAALTALGAINFSVASVYAEWG